MTLRLNGSTSGYVEVDAPAVSDNSLVTLPTGGGTLGRMQLMTAQSATGTAVDFTDIPSWVKRVTVMFNGVSGNGTSNLLIQIGSGSYQSSGYISGATSSATVGSTAGFIFTSGNAAAYTYCGVIMLATLGSNIWSAYGGMAPNSGTNTASFSAGAVTISGTLDRVRITTVNGADTFDAGTINLLLEG